MTEISARFISTVTELELSREEIVKQWRNGHFEVRTFQEALGVRGINGKVYANSFYSNSVLDILLTQVTGRSRFLFFT